MLRRRKLVLCFVLLLGIGLVMYPNNVDEVFMVPSREGRTIQDATLYSRFPKYIIVGFGKAGTKALYEVLKLHPSLSGPDKELRFFSSHYSRGLEWYLDSLPSTAPNVSAIEKSPDYIIHPNAPGRIFHTARAIGIDPYCLRFIVITRNPIDRALSEYVEWNLLRHREGKTLSPFHHLVIGNNDEVRFEVPIISSSCYSYHIKKWLQVFQRNQFCYVDGDKFIISPFEELHKLELCLGLTHFFLPEHLTYNMKTHFFCFNTSKLLCMNKSKGRSHPQIPVEVERRLQLFFKPWNRELEMIVAGAYNGSNATS